MSIATLTITVPAVAGLVARTHRIDDFDSAAPMLGTRLLTAVEAHVALGARDDLSLQWRGTPSSGTGVGSVVATAQDGSVPPLVLALALELESGS